MVNSRRVAQVDIVPFSGCEAALRVGVPRLVRNRLQFLSCLHVISQKSQVTRRYVRISHQCAAGIQRAVSVFLIQLEGHPVFRLPDHGLSIHQGKEHRPAVSRQKIGDIIDPILFKRGICKPLHLLTAPGHLSDVSLFPLCKVVIRRILRTVHL